MTVSTVVDHNDYTGNGVTTSFPYTFRIFKKSDLTVSVVDLAENITVLVLDTDYTVTNAGGYSGGNVVLATPLTNGWQISIARELEPTQETDLRNQGKFFAEVHEDAFDKLTMLIQQVGSMFRLALRKPSSIANWYDALGNYIRNLHDPRDPQDAATKNYVDTSLGRTLRVPEQIPQLPDAAARANKMPAFDSAGNPIVVIPPSGSASDVLIQLAKIDGESLIGGGVYSSIRAYDGSLTQIKCLGRANIFDKANGLFALDAADTTSADDDGTILIDSLGRRWKRIITGDVYPEWWGAKPDNSTGCGAAFQKAIDYCSGRNRPSVSSGLKLRIRGGRWIIDQPLEYIWRDTSNIVDDGDMRRLTIEGDGQSNTYLIYTGSSLSPALYVKGNTGTPNDGVQLRFEMRGFRLWRTLASTRLGVGIKTEDLAFMTMENVDVGYFNVNMQLYDTIQFAGRDCQISGANGGIEAKLIDFSNPNVLRFDNFRFSGNIVYCARFTNGANVAFIGGSCEGNGNDNNPATGQYCIHYIGGPAEGGCGLVVDNMYFENNMVYADVSIENNTSNHGSFSIEKNTFSKTNTVRFCNRHINLSSSGSGQLRPDIRGNAFKSFNGYVPSASYPVIVQQTGNIIANDTANFYQNALEKPNWNGYPTKGAPYSEPTMTARITSTGTLTAGWNVDHVTKIGTGQYDVYYKVQPNSSTVVFNGSTVSGPGQCVLGAEFSDRVTVSTYNTSGVLADIAFSFETKGAIGMY